MQWQWQREAVQSDSNTLRGVQVPEGISLSRVPPRASWRRVCVGILVIPLGTWYVRGNYAGHLCKTYRWSPSLHLSRTHATTTQDEFFIPIAWPTFQCKHTRPCYSTALRAHVGGTGYGIGSM
jgi:hypothetical protein